MIPYAFRDAEPSYQRSRVTALVILFCAGWPVPWSNTVGFEGLELANITGLTSGLPPSFLTPSAFASLKKLRLVHCGPNATSLADLAAFAQPRGNLTLLTARASIPGSEAIPVSFGNMPQ